MITYAFAAFASSLLVVLTLVMPVLSVRDYRRLLHRIREGRSDARSRSFVWTIVVEWGLTVGLLAWWLLAGGELGPLRLLPTAVGLQWLTIVIGMGIVAYLVLQMVTVLRNPDKLDEVRRQTRPVIATECT